MNFAQELTGIMRERNLSRKELSALTGLSQSSISQYLAGKNEPYDGRKKDIAKSLGLDENYFMVRLPEARTTDARINLPVSVAAKLMGKSIKWVTQGLQDKVFPWGYAVKLNQWSYFISSVKFEECTGIHIPEQYKPEERTEA